MKILRDIVGLFAVIALLAAGICLFRVCFWDAADFEAAGKNRIPVILAGVAYIVLAVVIVVIRFYRRKSDYLVFDREGGRVTIATKVIEDYIAKLMVEFPAVTKMTPKVTASRDSVDVIVDVRIKAGPQIREICEILQQRVRDSMFAGLGITQTRYVEVNVHKIVGQTEPDLRSASDEERP